MVDGSSSNTISEKVLSFIDYTNQHIFLTGKAGTGKTTLLRRIKEKCSKKMVVVAPTGVAAMNAKGTTINSFFQLPPGSFFPGDISLENLQSGILSIDSVVSNLSYSKDKTSLFNELQLLVIDEVSMVRCDLLDAIDAILRSVRKNNAPFGGLQLLLIGDLYQLPPVTKREDWTFLSRAYASPYFFEALAVKRNPVLQIELTTVYRQTEPEFIKILNDIRNNQIGEAGLALLNQRYDPQFRGTADLNPIIITSHNAEANAINKEKLDELAGEVYTFEAEISGEFKDLSIQAEQHLTLKEGAQVMFIKNDSGDDRRYYNGKIGSVKSIDEDHITIVFPNEADLLLEKTSWQSFEYKTDPDQEIIQHQVGEFSQYPIKLAWAVTIHKSQGLTFDHAIIDAGKSFAAGQVYVALSRVRTLDGLILKSKISTESLRSNLEVLNYMKPVKEEELDGILRTAQEKMILKLVLDHFTLQTLHFGIDTILSTPEVLKANLPEFKNLLVQLQSSITALSTLSDRLVRQVQQLHSEKGLKEQQVFQERIASAAAYFSKEIAQQLINPLNKNIRVKTKNRLQQQAQHLLIQYRQQVENRLILIQKASELLKESINVEDYTTWITQQKTKPHHQPRNSSGTQSIATLELF